VIDFKEAVEAIAKRIIESNYQSIGYIGGFEEVDHQVYLGERREIVFRDYLKKQGYYQKAFFHTGNFSLESGYQIMRSILTKNTYANVYFCANDSIAMGALRAIHEANLTVPDDIAIIGFNDTAMSAYMSPPLTTMKVYTLTLGEEALESIIERINRRTLPIKKIVPTKFIERATFKVGVTHD
jgi:LacI family transcriptional regulator